MHRFFSFSSLWNKVICDFVDSKKSGFFILLTLVYIACAMNMPVSIYTTAGHDDALFMNHAYKIIKGEWLGNYSQMTLVKGVGYSLFLAVNSIIGIPITLSIAFFYAFSCWLLTNILIRLKLPALAGLSLFTLMLFHPEVLPTRIIRDNIYPSLSLIIFAAVIDLCFLKQRNRIVLFFYGGAIALFCVTREEGIWIFPALFIIFIFQLFSDWRSHTRDKSLQLIRSSILLAGFIILPIALICSINQWKYGAFLTVDFKEENFSKSLSLLNSIEADTKISHVPVNKQQREIAYSVSPAFAELREFFEQTGTNWTKPGCNIYPETCGDYAGGWFMWAYRDAVFEKGHYKSFAQATDFYRNVVTEIEAACKADKIRCNSGSFGFLPKLSAEDVSEIPNSIANSYSQLTVQRPISLDSGPSTDSESRLHLLRFFLRQPLSTPSIEEDALHLTGWFYSSKSTENWLDLECRNPTGNTKERVTRQASPDIAMAMQNPAAIEQRFSFEVATPENCDLLTTAGKKLNLNQIYAVGPGPHSIGSDATLFIDSATRGIPHELKKFSSAVKYGLADIYKLLAPIAFWLGLFACAVSLIQHGIARKIPDPLIICAVAAWTLVFTRLAILILIDISSFPAINSLYMGPAFPLVFAAAILSIFSFRLRSRNN